MLGLLFINGSLGKKANYHLWPCMNTTNQIWSVAAQHQQFSAANNHYCCPCNAFLSDLGAFIHTHQDTGNSIILLGDMNRDIHHPLLHAFAMAHHLQEMILSCSASFLPPATFLCGSQSGTTPINNAWVSANIHVTQWCPIQLSPGNHHAMMLDINLMDYIGEPCYTIICPLGQCLNCSLPSVYKKYLHHLHAFALQHNLVPCLDSLFFLAQAPTTTKADLQQALESFDCTKSEGM